MTTAAAKRETIEEHAERAITPLAAVPRGLVAALIEAQRNYRAAVADQDNPFFNSKYVDLAGAWEACRDALWDQGLTVVQFPRVAAGGVVLVTRLEHVSGESREGEYPLTPTKDRDPQALGAAMTYARRYCLMAMAGLAPEDDDGNHASGKDEKRAEPKPAAAGKKVVDQRRDKLMELSGALVKLNLGGAAAAKLTGEAKKKHLNGCWMMYCAWATGLDAVNAIGDLTDAQLDAVLARAKAGEVPA